MPVAEHTHVRYERHIPPSIQERLEQFHECKVLESDLQSQLDKVQERLARLEDDLYPYRIEILGSSHNIHFTPIHRLPIEVLCSIFERDLISRHPSIRLLLLV